MLRNTYTTEDKLNMKIFKACKAITLILELLIIPAIIMFVASIIILCSNLNVPSELFYGAIKASLKYLIIVSECWFCFDFIPSIVKGMIEEALQHGENDEKE